MGWGLGLAVCGMILRHGMGAESLAWLGVFILAPVSAVYYPVTVLPYWLQYVSWLLPSTYVFEGMRAVMFDGVFRADYLLRAALLDAVFASLGALGFLAAFRDARRRGALLQMGE
jgi:ABC-2 type transport system permease protein